MSRFGFVGPTYESQSHRADAQRCQNWYPEAIESRDGASLMALYPRWGQTPFTALAGNKVRGEFEYNGRCFAVGDNFAELFADGHIAGYSFLPADNNPVTMAANNSNQLIICTAGQLWLFPLAPGAIIYNDVPLNISQIQIVDSGNPATKDYFITVSGTPPWTVGTTLAFAGVTVLPFLNGVIGTIVNISGSVVQVQLSRNLTLAFSTGIVSISTSLSAGVMSATITLSGPCPYTAGKTVTFAGLTAVPLLNGLTFTIQSVVGNTFTITGVPYVTSSANASPTTAGQKVPIANASSSSTWNIPAPPFPAGPNWTSYWVGNLFHSWDLYMEGCGFAIPSSAQIVDVSVTLNFTVNPTWPQSQNTSTPQLWLWLVKADAQYGTLRSESAPTAGLSGSRSLTQSNGVSGDSWSPAEINAANFGASFAWGNGMIAGDTSPFHDRTVQVTSVAVTVDFINLYSGAESGTTSSELVNYGPGVDTGTVTGKVVSGTTGPVQVAAGLGPFVCVDFIDGYFVALQQNSQIVYYSGWQDGTNWSGAYIRVSRFAENCIAMLVNRSEIWLWSEKHTIVYYDTGDLNNPFAPIDGAFIEAGIAGPWCAVRMDNSVFWILADERGFKVAMRAEGYTPVRVSTHAMEETWGKFGNMADVIGYAMQHTGHAFWHLYFPSDDWSVRYDAATRMWSEISFFDGSHHAHHSRCHALAFGKHLIGDTASGNVLLTAESLLTDNVPNAPNSPIRRVRRAPHINNELEWEFHHRLRVHLDTGLGPVSELPTVAVGAPYLFAQDSNGNNWQIGINDNGIQQPVSLGSGTAPAPMIFVDIAGLPAVTCYTLSVTPTGTLLLVAAPGVFTGYYKRVPMMTLPSALQTYISVQYGAIMIDPPLAATREPQVMLRWSDDGGNTWSNEYAAGAGMAGEFSRRVEWRRLGRSRDRVYEIACTDPIPWRIVDAYLYSTPSNQQPMPRYATQMAKMA